MITNREKYNLKYEIVIKQTHSKNDGKKHNNVGRKGLTVT